MNSNYIFGGLSKSEGGNSPPGGAKQAIGRCGVCGDKAYFHNFNALTCQACKGELFSFDVLTNNPNESTTSHYFIP